MNACHQEYMGGGGGGGVCTLGVTLLPSAGHTSALHLPGQCMHELVLSGLG